MDYITYSSGERRKAKRFTCVVCGTTFLRDCRHITNDVPTCSRKCKSIAAGTKAVSCCICNKIVYRKQCRVTKNKSGVFCCSNSCLDVAKRLGMVKTGPSKTYKYFCSKCGTGTSKKTKTGLCKKCYIQSDEAKQSRSNALKGCKNTRGWQSRKILSYPEKFFYKVLTDNGIIFEGPNVPVSKRALGLDSDANYFLDFKIGMVDLEIDGSQHWQYEERASSDKIRDAALTKFGYTVYRIRWKSINTVAGKKYIANEITKLLEFLRGCSSAGRAHALQA